MLYIPIGNSFRLWFPLKIKTGDVSHEILNAEELSGIQVFAFRDRDSKMTEMDAIVVDGRVEAEVTALLLAGQYWNFRLTAMYHGRRIQANWHHALFTVKEATEAFERNKTLPLDEYAVSLAYMGEAGLREIADLREENRELLDLIAILRHKIDLLLGDGAGDSLMRLCVFDYNPHPAWLRLHEEMPVAYLPDYLLIGGGGSMIIETPTEEAYNLYFLVSTKDVSVPYAISHLRPFKVIGGRCEVIMPHITSTERANMIDSTFFAGIIKISVPRGGEVLVQVTDPCHLYGVVVLPKL